MKLVDYKTSKAKKRIDKEQLVLYKLAAEEVLGKSVSSLSYYYLDGQEEVSFEPKEKDEERVQSKILSSLESLKAGDFHPDGEPIKCKFCDYKDICQYSRA